MAALPAPTAPPETRRAPRTEALRHAAPDTRPEGDETPYDRYLRTMPDGAKGDLVCGEAVIEMSTSVTHELIFGFLYTLLKLYVEERGLGVVLGSRTLMKVDDENDYEPDVLFVRADRLDIIGDLDIGARVDLAVEIVSRTSGRRDRETKFEGYERLGVPEYWLVDPLRGEAAFYRLDDSGRYRAVPLAAGVFESTAVPGFRLDPQVLVAETLPPVLPLLTDLLARPLPATEAPVDAPDADDASGEDNASGDEAPGDGGAA